MPIIIGLNKPNSYRVVAITISNNEGNSIDISDMVNSWEITESIYQMFLTGWVMILDNQNAFNRLNITGQEYIRIHVAGVEGNEEEVPEDEQINQVFRVYNVSNYIRDNKEDLSKTGYRLDFCSPLMYESRTKRISKHFTGTTAEIIKEICDKELNFIDKPNNNLVGPPEKNDVKPLVKGGKELGNYFDIISTDAKNSGDTGSFLCPNWTVHKALRYLRDNTSIDDNLPYGDSFYLYQTALNGFRFCNIDTMRNMVYLSGDVKFAPRDSAATMSGWFDNPDGMNYDMIDYNKVSMYNKFRGHVAGLYSGMTHSYNTVSKQINVIDSQFTQQFSVDDSNLYDSNKTISKAPPFRIGNEGIRIPADGAPDGEQMPVAPVAINGDPIISRFGSAVNFDYEVPHTFSNVIETEVDKTDSSIGTSASTKYHRERVESLFENNRINILIGGRTNISAGMMIDVDIPMPKPIPDDTPDIQHNDRLLVESVRWTGSQKGLECNLSCTTDGHQVSADVSEVLPYDEQY